jgi:hypothetical protein
MKQRTVTLPEIGMIAGTRALLGAGIGLLIADKLSDDHRRTVGWTLLAVGALTTIPLAAEVLMHSESAEDQNGRLARRIEGDREIAETRE